MKINFYSAMFGKYDKVSPLDPKISKNFNFIIYTDLQNLKASGYDIRVIKKPHVNPSLANRMIKFNPSKYCNKCDFAIYHDSNIQIKKEFIDYVSATKEKLQDLNLFAHPNSNSIKEELIKVLQVGKISFSEFETTLQYLKNNNIDIDSNNFTENNILISNPNSLILNNIFQECIDNLIKILGRDQIILSALLLKHNYKYRLNETLLVSQNSLYFDYRPHITNILNEIFVRFSKYRNKLKFEAMPASETFFLSKEERTKSHIISQDNINSLNDYSKKLSIVILTYNRPQIFEEGLNELITYCRPFLIKIFVSDDSGTDWFEQKVNELKKKYEHIYIKKNNPPLKHDKNIISSLKIPNTEYVWLLGDSIRLDLYGIRKIISIINHLKPNLIAVNAIGRKLNYTSKIISNNNEIISDFGWHLTLTGATIYSKNVIKFIDKINFQKIKNFPQFYLIFNFLGNSKANFVWINDRIVRVDGKRSNSYWASNAFEVFLDDLKHTLTNLRHIYSDKTINHVFESHTSKTGLFSIRGLIKLRSLGSYNYQIYNKYKFQIESNTKSSLKILYILSILPQRQLNNLINIYSRFTGFLKIFLIWKFLIKICNRFGFSLQNTNKSK